MGVVLLVAHLFFVCWLTLRPVSMPWVTPSPVEPLATIKADLALSPWQATRSIGAGLLLLAPLGLLLPLAGGRVAVSRLTSLIRTAFTGAMVSLILELLDSGVTGRVMSTDALLLNTAGVALTHLAVVPAVRARLRRRAERARRRALPRDDGQQAVTPTRARVGVAP